MRLEEITQKRLVEYLSLHHHKDEWRVLVLDSIVYDNLTSLMDLHSLLSYDILTIQKLSEKREKVEYPAVYICHFDEQTKNQIKQDIKDSRYSGYRILTINASGEFSVTVRDGVKISKTVVKYEQIDLCYKLEGEVVIVKPNDLSCLCRVLNINPHVHVAQKKEADELTNDKKIGESVNDIFEEKIRIGDLLILNRRLDVLTPLCHFYSFENILRDYKLLQEQLEGPLWESVRYLHLAEVNDVLSEKSRELMAGLEKINQADTKDLTRLVLEAPQTVQEKETLTKLLDLADHALTVFEQSGQQIGSYEMDIVNGYTVRNRKVSIEPLLEILKDPKIAKMDKLRLLLLVQSTRGIEDIKMQIEETNLNIDWIENMPKQSPHKKKNFTYEVSRYTPRLKKILNDFFDKKDFIYSFSEAAPVSLRKKGFHFKAETKRTMILYFINGVTYEEIRIAKEIGERESVNVLVASDQLLLPDIFVQKVRRGEI